MNIYSDPCNGYLVNNLTNEVEYACDVALKMQSALKKFIDKNIVLEEYEGEEREGHIMAHMQMAIRDI
jgi:hypothetical protein